MFCIFCGNKVPDGSRFCPYCGKLIDTEAPGADASPPDEEPSRAPDPPPCRESADAPAEEASASPGSAGEAGEAEEPDAGDAEPEEAASENGGEEAVLDLFQELDHYRSTGQTDSPAYFSAQEKEKKAYFWYKLSYLMGSLLFFAGVELFFINEDVPTRVVIVILFLVGLCCIPLLVGPKIERLTTLKYSDISDEGEKDSKRLQHGFEKEHPASSQWVTGLGIAICLIGVVLFCICYFYQHADMEYSLHFGLRFVSIFSVSMSCVWSLKWISIPALILLFAILTEGRLFSNCAGSIPSYQENLSFSDIQESNEYADMIAIDFGSCYTYTPEYSDALVLHIEYDFTNLTDSKSTAYNLFHPEASQNGVEAEVYYGDTEYGSNQMKEVEVGATVRISKEFELNDSVSPVTIQFVKTWNFTSKDEVYLEVQFQLAPGSEASAARQMDIEEFLGSWVTSEGGITIELSGTADNLYYNVTSFSHTGRIANAEGYGTVIDRKLPFYTDDDLWGNEVSGTIYFQEDGTLFAECEVLNASPYADWELEFGRCQFFRGEAASNYIYEYQASDSYLLPTDSQYITEADLYGMSRDELSLARNEIYSRHGYTFSSASLRAYFASQSWYTPVEGLNASNFDLSVFNDYEAANLNTILAYENSLSE